MKLIYLIKNIYQKKKKSALSELYKDIAEKNISLEFNFIF